jgi:hypothetical protein
LSNAEIEIKFRLKNDTTKVSNKFFSLKINNEIIYDQKMIRYYIFNYYKDLLGSLGNKILTFDPNIWFENEKLTQDVSLALETSFTIE